MRGTREHRLPTRKQAAHVIEMGVRQNHQVDVLRPQAQLCQAPNDRRGLRALALWPRIDEHPTFMPAQKEHIEGHDDLPIAPHRSGHRGGEFLRAGLGCHERLRRAGKQVSAMKHEGLLPTDTKPMNPFVRGSGPLGRRGGRRTGRRAPLPGRRWARVDGRSGRP